MDGRRIALCLLLFLIATVPLMAQGTYTQIDYPGSTSTDLYGINTTGGIVGDYKDADGLEHGFLLSGSVYTTIDYPGAANTALLGLNDMGQIVGTTDSTPYIGFLYNLATQSFTTVDFPGATATYPHAINNAGMIAGSFYNSNGAAGFESEGSTYRMIIPRMTSDAAVWGISDSGYLVGNGTLKQQGTSVNFIFRHGIYSPITIPNAPKAVVFGINSAGTIAVGFYDLPSDYQVGFSYQNGVTLELNFSGALDTVALGVNNFGEVVGYFEDTDGITVHGFLWTPPAEAPKP